MIETIAVIFGLACVIFCVKENPWCWPTGLVQVCLYAFIFFQARLYSDVILQVILIVINLYGWYHWIFGGKQQKRHLHVSLLKNKPTLILFVLSFIAAALWGTFMKDYTNAALPYADAFIVAMNLLGQVLMALKKVESWYFWLAADIVSIFVFAHQQLYKTSVLYATFFVLAYIGLRSWRKSYYSTIKAEAV